MNQFNQGDCIRCPRCKRKIMESCGSGAVLRNRLTIFDKERTVAVCKHCKMEVSVPIRIVA